MQRTCHTNLIPTGRDLLESCRGSNRRWRCRSDGIEGYLLCPRDGENLGGVKGSITCCNSKFSLTWRTNKECETMLDRTLTCICYWGCSNFTYFCGSWRIPEDQWCQNFAESLGEYSMYLVYVPVVCIVYRSITHPLIYCCLNRRWINRLMYMYLSFIHFM